MRKQQVEWSEKRRQRRWLMSYQQPEDALRRFRRRTVRLCAALGVNVILLVPFFKDNFLHQYWETVGNSSMFTGLGLFSSLRFSWQA